MGEVHFQHLRPVGPDGTDGAGRGALHGTTHSGGETERGRVLAQGRKQRVRDSSKPSSQLFLIIKLLFCKFILRISLGRIVLYKGQKVDYVNTNLLA